MRIIDGMRDFIIYWRDYSGKNPEEMFHGWINNYASTRRPGSGWPESRAGGEGFWWISYPRPVLERFAIPVEPK